MSVLELRPGLADVPVAESAVSDLDGIKARLLYRGIAVESLARDSTFEETAWLLLKGELPTQKQLAEFDSQLRQRRAVHFRMIDLIKTLPPTGHPMDALQTTVSALGMFAATRSVSDASANWEACLRLIAGMPSLVAAYHRVRSGLDPIAPRNDLDHAGNFCYMLNGKVPSPAVRKMLDACLILHAEHQMNASTFTARVVGSTLADPYRTISAAIGALAGPLHGGANEEALDMLEKIGKPENAKAWLEKTVAAKGKIMGFGHRVYKVKDPRATVLQELAENVFAESSRPQLYDIALELEQAAVPLLGPKGIYPNVDFFSGIVYQSLGIPSDQFTPIFAVARVAGWLAHWLEQLQNNRIFRPEQIYAGPAERAYVPLAERA
ncbi:MAG: citrate synthase [Gemmataceae bacterium]